MEKLKSSFVFEKQNYQLMIIGLVIIIVGYVLMSGGSGDDPTAFYPEIFNSQRLTVAPIIILIGLLIEIYAIMKPKSSSKE
jgi:hypothetical protein